MIAILMATYNGEDYLSGQLDSLFDQTIQDFTLYISDDCSTDRTWQIIEKYCLEYPDRIISSKREKNSGNAKYNFMELMIKIKADYVMLCDQDDVWIPDKIEKSLNKLKQMEIKYSQETPLLVHTDLRVVDKNLELINLSFKEAMNANYTKTELNNQLIQNTLTGCTAIYNRSLANFIAIEPRYCVMHDWWLMLVASAFGKIDHLDYPTVLYRQHDKNGIGAKDVRTLKYKMNKIINNHEVKEAINNTYIQAESFLEVYKKCLTEEQLKLLETYILVPKMNKWGRWRTICKLGVLKNGIARKIANFIFV